MGNGVPLLVAKKHLLTSRGPEVRDAGVFKLYSNDNVVAWARCLWSQRKSQFIGPGKNLICTDDIPPWDFSEDLPFRRRLTSRCGSNQYYQSKSHVRFLANVQGEPPPLGAIGSDAWLNEAAARRG